MVNASNNRFIKTDLGVLPTDWVVKTLGEVCIKIQDGNYGGSYPKSNEFLAYGVPFLTSKAIGKDGVLKRQLIDFISQEKHSELSKAHLQLNDVLFTNRGASVGAIGFVDESISNGNIGPQLTLLRSNDEVIISMFLYQIMKSEMVQRQILSQDSGSAMNFYSIGATKKFLITYPSKTTEQVIIAEALSDTDTLIDDLNRLIMKKKAIKQGAMQQLLTGKKRLSGFSGEWETKKLGELLDYEQPTEYLVHSTEYNDNNTTPVLTAGKTFILGYTDEENGIFNKLPVIIFDDFTTAVQFVDFPFKAKSSAMKMLLPKNKVNIRFVFELMTQIYFPVGDHKRHWIGEYQYIDIKIPSVKEEQDAIANILSDMDSEIKSLELKRDKYIMIKQGMMQQLLTGRIRLYGTN